MFILLCGVSLHVFFLQVIHSDSVTWKWMAWSRGRLLSFTNRGCHPLPCKMSRSVVPSSPPLGTPRILPAIFMRTLRSAPLGSAPASAWRRRPSSSPRRRQSRSAPPSPRRGFLRGRSVDVRFDRGPSGDVGMRRARGDRSSVTEGEGEVQRCERRPVQSHTRPVWDCHVCRSGQGWWAASMAVPWSVWEWIHG